MNENSSHGLISVIRLFLRKIEDKKTAWKRQHGMHVVTVKFGFRIINLFKLFVQKNDPLFYSERSGSEAIQKSVKTSSSFGLIK